MYYLLSILITSLLREVKLRYVPVLVQEKGLSMKGRLNEFHNLSMQVCRVSNSVDIIF
ncbi:hypothetical protein D3C76_1563490 [compost metagenome]